MATRAEIPEDASVCTVLPQIIDTPQNRYAMPDADRYYGSRPSRSPSHPAAADGDGGPRTARAPAAAGFCLLRPSRVMCIGAGF